MHSVFCSKDSLLKKQKQKKKHRVTCTLEAHGRKWDFFSWPNLLLPCQSENLYIHNDCWQGSKYLGVKYSVFRADRPYLANTEYTICKTAEIHDITDVICRDYKQQCKNNTAACIAVADWLSIHSYFTQWMMSLSPNYLERHFMENNSFIHHFQAHQISCWIISTN